MIGALLELAALWRIGSTLDRMDRRQAEMNALMIPGESAVEENRSSSFREERIEPHFDGVSAPPAMTAKEAAEWVESWDKARPPAPATIITVPYHEVAPAIPLLTSKKLAWWCRIARWIAN